jgi:hypothetical protein
LIGTSANPSIACGIEDVNLDTRQYSAGLVNETAGDCSCLLLHVDRRCREIGDNEEQNEAA